jgi:hypothetical protein
MYSIYKNNYIKYISILLILTLVLSSCGKNGNNILKRDNSGERTDNLEQPNNNTNEKKTDEDEEKQIKENKRKKQEEIKRYKELDEERAKARAAGKEEYKERTREQIKENERKRQEEIKKYKQDTDNKSIKEDGNNNINNETNKEIKDESKNNKVNNVSNNDTQYPTSYYQQFVNPKNNETITNTNETKNEPEETGIIESIKDLGKSTIGWVNSTWESITEHPIITGIVIMGTGTIAAVAPPAFIGYIDQREITKIYKEYDQALQNPKSEKNEIINKARIKLNMQEDELEKQLHIDKEKIRSKGLNINDYNEEIDEAETNWETKLNKEKKDYKAIRAKAKANYLRKRREIEKETGEKIRKLKDRQQKRSRLTKWIREKLFKKTLKTLGTLYPENFGNGKTAIGQLMLSMLLPKEEELEKEEDGEFNQITDEELNQITDEELNQKIDKAWKRRNEKIDKAWERRNEKIDKEQDEREEEIKKKYPNPKDKKIREQKLKALEKTFREAKKASKKTWEEARRASEKTWENASW